MTDPERRERAIFDVIDAANHASEDGVVTLCKGCLKDALLTFAAQEAQRATEAERGLRSALINLLNRHVRLVSGGDCGDWDVETEPEVMDARAALRHPTPASEQE